MTVVTLTTCTHEDEIEPGTSQPPVPVPVVDITPPSIKVMLSSVDITGVEQIIISGNELRVGNLLVASWTDNMTKSCQVQMTFDGSAISSGEVANKE